MGEMVTKQTHIYKSVYRKNFNKAFIAGLSKNTGDTGSQHSDFVFDLGLEHKNFSLSFD